MLISGLMLTGGAVASYWGVEHYFGPQSDSTLIDVLTPPRPWIAQPKRVGVLGKSTGSLASKLSPDRFVPASRKVHGDVPYADRSPWKDHVVMVNGVRVQDGAEHVTTLMDEARLVGKYIYTYWSPYWAIGIASGLLLMSGAVYRLLAAQALRVIVDVGTRRGAVVMFTELAKLAIALPTTFGLVVLGQRLSARLNSRIGSDIRHDLFMHLHALSQDFHKDAKLGDLVSRFSLDTYRLETAIGQGLVTDAGNVIMLVVNFMVMVAFSPMLALLSLVPIAPIVYPTKRVMQYATTTERRLNKQKGLMSNAVQESMRGQTLIASFGLESLFAGYFDAELQRLEEAKTEGVFSVGLFQQLSIYSSLFFALWVLGTGSLFVVSGAITVGTLVGFMMLANNLYLTFSQLVNGGGARWIQAYGGAQRIEELLQHQAQITDAENACVLPPFQHQLQFGALCFSYDGKQRQLQGIDLTIEAGQFVAFVGPSGAGKSTIFNLLMRFYDASAGRITIDGHDLRAVTQASLRAQMGVVLQETFIFHTTILDNIRIVKPDADEAQVITAAKAAELHDFVQSLPDGYQTIVGEAGGRLSGGQRQRIAVARALLYNPPILLLDEATSSLSAEIADAIIETIVALAGKHTIIMITHQLQAVVKADTIFVLNQGHLVEQGTHADLLASEGLYQHLWSTQNNHILQLAAENGQGHRETPARTTQQNGTHHMQEKRGLAA